jgi:WD domain, G-beta repeat
VALLAHRHAIYCVACDHAGTRIVTGSDDNIVKVWDVRRTMLLASLLGHTKEITDLSIRCDDVLLASADTGGLLESPYLIAMVDGSFNLCSIGYIRVWLMATGAPVTVLHANQVRCPSFHVAFQARSIMVLGAHTFNSATLITLDGVRRLDAPPCSWFLNPIPPFRGTQTSKLVIPIRRLQDQRGAGLLTTPEYSNPLGRCLPVPTPWSASGPTYSTCTLLTTSSPHEAI